MHDKSLKSNTSDVSYKKFVNYQYENINRFKITYNFLTVDKVVIENSDFSNCDIIGSRLNNIILSDVKLLNTDIVSNELNKAIFINVNFDGAGIEDVNFKNCNFKSCNFDNFSMKNCIFTNCLFENLEPISSLMELNTYYNCKFNSCKFTSSFHYQIFDNCNFDNVFIKPELLGYNYGLFFYPNIESGLKLLEKNITKENPILNLAKYFTNQYLYINSMILVLNTEPNINQNLFLSWANTLRKTIKHNGIIKSNELNFIKNILVNIFNENLIAPIVMINLYNQLIDIYKKYEYTNRTQESLLILINSIYREIQIYIANLNKEIEALPSYNGIIEISIKYKVKPLISLCKLLNEFGVGQSIQTKTKTGSFYEWIESPDNILACLKIFISLLGVTVPIITKSIKDKKERKNNPQNTDTILPDVFVNANNITINVNIQNGCKIINNNQFIQNDFYGYTDENIEYITINFQK